MNMIKATKVKDMSFYESLNPVVGALVHNAGSIFVIINSAFLLKWKSKK